MIRLLNQTDAAAYRRIRLRALQSEPDSFCASLTAENEKPELFLEKCLKDGSEVPFAYGAFEDGQLAGITGFAKEELLQVYVLPPFRGKGLARGLAFAAAAHAFEKLSALQFVKAAVILHPGSALKFYEELGFETVGLSRSTHNGYGIMQLRLSRDKLL